MQLEIKSSFHVVYEVHIFKMLTLGIPFSNHINVLNATSDYNSDNSIYFNGSNHSTVSREHKCSNKFTSCKKSTYSLMQICLLGDDIEKVQ